MANYPRHQVQADLKEVMHSKNQEWFTSAALELFYKGLIETRPMSRPMSNTTFSRMINDQSKMPCSWIEQGQDERGRVMYRIRNGACYFDGDCKFSPLYSRAMKILNWQKNHTWFK